MKFLRRETIHVYFLVTSNMKNEAQLRDRERWDGGSVAWSRKAPVIRSE